MDITCEKCPRCIYKQQKSRRKPKGYVFPFWLEIEAKDIEKGILKIHCEGHCRTCGLSFEFDFTKPFFVDGVEVNGA